jgi:hypothetical protein
MSYNYQAPPASYFSTTMEENDDLHWAIENDPHVVTFWSAVYAFINYERDHGEDPDRVLECPSWGQWRSIGQHLAAGKKVEAIKLLRASTCAWTQVQPPVPQGIGNEKWKTFMAANALPAWDHRGGLSLSEAKGIIDTLEAAPYWFGRDTNREFSSRHVTCADGGHDIGGPKSLDDLLREKISAMKAEEEAREHSLWLNIYPDMHPCGTLCDHPTREAADASASCGRIACINIKFKEGEGL